MPAAITPMLASLCDEPFDDPNWLFEIKWDGYRAVAFLDDGDVRLVSRNHNDLTAKFPELGGLSKSVKAKNAILDGEIVVLDDQGRPSFSLMQQRTGFRSHGRQSTPREGVPILYYVFDVIYLDGYDLRRVRLEERKSALREIVSDSDIMRYSDHFGGNGKALFNVAKEKGLEGIIAKKANSCYEERRSREWQKIKITQTVDCVIGGYTEPEGSRQYFGSLMLGLYNEKFERTGGDACIRRMARVISSSYRRGGDLVGHWEGGTFVVVIQGDAAERAAEYARVVAQRARDLLIHHPRGGGGAERYLTLSAGVASLVPPRELPLDALVNACRTALTRSKKQGKNCIATAEAADFQ